MFFEHADSLVGVCKDVDRFVKINYNSYDTTLNHFFCSLSSRVITLRLKDYDESPEEAVKQEKSCLEVDEEDADESKIQVDDSENVDTKGGNQEVVKVGRSRRTRKKSGDENSESSAGKRKIVEELQRTRRQRSGRDKEAEEKQAETDED